MNMTVYWGSGSPFAWSVLLALAAKGLAFESKRLDMMSGEHKTPEFLRLNPRGKVPVLVHGDVVISESLAILTYVDAVQPEPPLFGTTPADKAAVMAALSAVMSYVEPSGTGIAVAAFFRPWDDAAQAAIAEAVVALTPEIERIEALLAGQDYLAGARLSAADLRLYPMLQLLGRVRLALARRQAGDNLLPLLREQRPALERWCRRIEALPGYDATYPPHWRQG